MQAGPRRPHGDSGPELLAGGVRTWQVFASFCSGCAGVLGPPAWRVGLESALGGAAARHGMPRSGCECDFLPRFCASSPPPPPRALLPGQDAARTSLPSVASGAGFCRRP